MKGTYWITLASVLVASLMALCVVTSTVSADAAADSANSVCDAKYTPNDLVTDGFIENEEWSQAQRINLDMNGLNVLVLVIFNDAYLFVGASIPDQTEYSNERFDLCIDVIASDNIDAPDEEDLRISVPRGYDFKPYVGNGEYWVLSSERIYSVGRSSTNSGWEIEIAVHLISLERYHTESRNTG